MGSGASHKPNLRIKTFGTVAKNKSNSLKIVNKTAMDYTKKYNESLSHHDLNNKLPKSSNVTWGKPKLKLMTKNMAALKNKKNTTTITAKEKQGSALFAKNSKDGSLLKAASKSNHNEKKKAAANNSTTVVGGARNISASDVSRSALTIVEDLVDIINSTHGKNKKNNTNPTNEKTAK